MASSTLTDSVQEHADRNHGSEAIAAHHQLKTENGRQPDILESIKSTQGQTERAPDTATSTESQTATKMSSPKSNTQTPSVISQNNEPTTTRDNPTEKSPLESDLNSSGIIDTAMDDEYASASMAWPQLRDHQLFMDSIIQKFCRVSLPRNHSISMDARNYLQQILAAFTRLISMEAMQSPSYADTGVVSGPALVEALYHLGFTDHAAVLANFVMSNYPASCADTAVEHARNVMSTDIAARRQTEQLLLQILTRSDTGTQLYLPADIALPNIHTELRSSLANGNYSINNIRKKIVRVRQVNQKYSGDVIKTKRTAMSNGSSGENKQQSTGTNGKATKKRRRPLYSEKSASASQRSKKKKKSVADK